MKKVSDFIEKQRLLSHDGLHLVALSGGADSVALLRLLLQMDYRVEAVHCNFHLRGAESDRDEIFVRSLCDRLQVPLHLAHFDTREYASLHHVSIEMAARDLRYAYFRQLRHDVEAETVCVAHHRDDAVETLLMNLIRGTGIHGLTGIRPVHDFIVRPLLCLSRLEIEEYLHSIGQDYVVDSSNLVNDVVRNKIRLDVIPLLQSINPRASENIGKTANFLREAERELDALRLNVPLEQRSPDATGTQQTSIPKSRISSSFLLHEWLSPLGFNSTQVTQIFDSLHGPSGRTFTSPTHTLCIDRDSLVVEPTVPPMKPLKMPEPGLYRYTDRLSLEVACSADVTISKSALVATLDASKVAFPLTVRPVQAGDRFIPFGMQGHRLVSDFLTDRKLNLLEKRRQLVVTDARDTIVWLVGLRTDQRFCVTPDTTSVLSIHLHREKK